MGAVPLVAEAAAQVVERIIERPVETGTSAGETVAIMVAAASFVISVAALYATALKRAQIGIHQATADRPWRVAGWSGLAPTGEHYVMLAVYAHNAGANAGILEDVEASSHSTLDGLFDQLVTWYPLKSAPETHPSVARTQLPHGIDAGEIEEAFFIGRVYLSLAPTQRFQPDEQADMELEETFARQLYQADSLPVTVTWRYARPAELVGNRQPTTKTGTLRADVPVAGLRDQFIAYWKSQTQHAVYETRARRLVSIATTGAT